MDWLIGRGLYDQPPTPVIDDETPPTWDEKDAEEFTTMKPKLFEEEESIEENEPIQEDGIPRKTL